MDLFFIFLMINVKCYTPMSVGLIFIVNNHYIQNRLDVPTTKCSYFKELQYTHT